MLSCKQQDNKLKNCCIWLVIYLARPRTKHDYHHNTKVKPEAATAVIELLMMGGKTPETCWAVNKRLDNKLKNCCIWLVIYLNCTMMHGLTNLKFMEDETGRARSTRRLINWRVLAGISQRRYVVEYLGVCVTKMLKRIWGKYSAHMGTRFDRFRTESDRILLYNNDGPWSSFIKKTEYFLTEWARPYYIILIFFNVQCNDKSYHNSQYSSVISF